LRDLVPPLPELLQDLSQISKVRFFLPSGDFPFWKLEFFAGQPADLSLRQRYNPPFDPFLA
jgi:hypothetical protein